MTEYNSTEIEKKWQKKWAKNNLYRAIDFDARPKSYILIEFPYTSGERLHVGHARSYSCLDAVARKRRMQGYNVLFPIGWDAFGLPAENYAVKTGIHPAITTAKIIADAKAQIVSWGLSFDWDREITTSDPNYYKWTQWIFVQLFKQGLAYKDEIPVNWCPSCKINLANEEVIDGKCERCGTVTQRRRQNQWLLRITKYADRLLKDLDTVDYRQDIKQQQINWIGKKQGINIKYQVEGMDQIIEVFTTTPVNWGATFLVLAPEHSLIASIKTPKVTKYVKEALSKSELNRLAEGKAKTGVFSDLYAINHVNGKKIPIWISDFVLAYVGTGAIQGCPGHDKRDFEFAKKYSLPIPRVVTGPNGETGEITRLDQVVESGGVMVNSDFLNGMKFAEAMEKTMDYFEQKGWGKRTVTYHLRDWVFSRQHYWGEPIPMIYCPSCAAKGECWFSQANQACPVDGKSVGWYPVPENQLPVELPQVKKYQPTETGESPLATMTDWVNTDCPKCGQPARRETDTMPNWAGSSWYYLRYIDPHNSSQLTDKKKLEYWTPVDWYNGGMEHTTLHLLYSRFWHKFLFDLNIVPTPEPYAKRSSHGVVLGPDGRRMSKSKGNVINPDDVVKKYGADTLRLYEMFIGPFSQVVAWSWTGVEGVFRFLKRVWVLANSVGNQKSSSEAKSKMSKLIKKTEEDLETTKFNTAVSSMMEFVNWWQENPDQMGKDVVEDFIKVVAPLAPFIAEEMWSKLGHSESVHLQSWPKYDESMLSGDKTTIIVQVNGKLRERLELENRRAGEQEYVCQLALASAKVKNQLKDSKYREIFVPGKLINFVV